MLEKYAFPYVVMAGAALVALGVLWFLIAAINWRKAVRPLLLMLLGVVVAAVPFGVNYYYQRHLNLGPREKVVDGELHITLTGWDRSDYSVLQDRSQTVVLQMANPDVDDATLQYLKGMKQLEELDLNDTQVTDEGLRTLSELPRLEALRLRKTPITDEGFRKYLLPMESLKQLDLRGTKVASKTVREWKAAQPDRKALH